MLSTLSHWRSLQKARENNSAQRPMCLALLLACMFIASHWGSIINSLGRTWMKSNTTMWPHGGYMCLDFVTRWSIGYRICWGLLRCLSEDLAPSQKYHFLEQNHQNTCKISILISFRQELASAGNRGNQPSWILPQTKFNLEISLQLLASTESIKSSNMVQALMQDTLQ